jgi:hypothetical protein
MTPPYDHIAGLQRIYAADRQKHPRTFGDVLAALFGRPGTARIVPMTEHSRATVTRYHQVATKQGRGGEDGG